MSRIMTESEKPQTNTLTENDVITWLRKNPNILNRHPDLFDVLTPPQKKQGKGIADFQYYMVERLKADRDEVLESAREVVETSRANMSNQSRIHMVTLMLLEAHSFEDFIHTLTMDTASILGVDIISLIVEADGDVVPHIDLSGVRAVPAGTVSLLMKEKSVILEANIAGFDEIYGGGSGLVKSQTLLRLNLTGISTTAMLAFGSRDPEMFQDGQGTEQIIFLGRVIERCFRLWLDLPPQ